MSGEFITPNWHVLLIHYPIALLTLGVLLELGTLCCPRSAARSAGRWMILLGALSAIPTGVLGIYALRDAAVPGPGDPEPMPWRQVVDRSPLSAAQWEFLSRHAWLNGLAVAAFLLAVLAWLVSAPAWREKLYWPLLGLLLVGLALLPAGAWHGGEAVYRYGTAVESAGGPTDARAAREGRHGHAHAQPGGGGEAPAGVRRYLPP